MALSPENWSVVVTGAWNRAILTPFWVSTKLFNVDPASPAAMQVVVPIDGIGPQQFRTDDARVLFEPGKLTFPPSTLDAAGLQSALRLATAAIDALPETPLTGAGINANFSGAEVSAELQDMFSSAFDEALNTLNYTANRMSVSRQVQFDEGVINIQLTRDEQADRSYLVSLNFHRDRDTVDNASIQAWLNCDVESVIDAATTIITNGLNETIESTPLEEDVE